MEKIEKLLLIMPLGDEQYARIRSLLPGTEIVLRDENDVTTEDVRMADVILGNPPPEFLRGADGVRWLQLSSAGSDNFAALVPEKMLLTNASGAYGGVISEFMLAAVLALMKRLPQYRDNMKTGAWASFGTVPLISGSCCLVLGMGDIGGTFAQKMKALDAYVIGVRRTAGDKPDYVDELHTIDALSSLLPRADVVAMSLPNSPETAGLINKDRLVLMKRGALLVNVGRGASVVTDDLLESLRSGQLGGAALDVTDPEPLPPEHPLWQEPGALITPHCSGNWSNSQIADRLIDLFEQNLRRFYAGERLINTVSRQTGYREKI